MACLLQSLLPTSSSRGRLPSRAPRRARVAAAEAAVVRCARAGAADGARGGGADDYHATVRALNSKGARRNPRKSLGQHYMLNSSINEQLSSIADIKEGDVVLEIGPGTGALTNVLIDAGATVVAVEKDARMAALVRDRFGGSENLMILQEDFTKCHVHSYIGDLLESKKSMGTDIEYAKIKLFSSQRGPANHSLSVEINFLVVSNVPFNISTEIVKELLPMGDIFSNVVLLLQDETALRLADSSLPTSNYRSINVFVNFYSDAEYRFKVERTNFFPQPNVDAAVVAFKLKRTADYPEVVSIKGFFSMVNSAFSEKRKMLRKSLQHMCTSFEIEEALRKAGLPVTSRPEELSLDDFVRLHNLLATGQLSASI